MENSEYDLVYILKRGDYNPDLRYSLRSVAKYCTFRNIWLVGYCPSWVQNVFSIDLPQEGSKYSNSTDNLIAACQHPDISQKFILMNDDFYALKKIKNWETSCNKSRGSGFALYQNLRKKMPMSGYRNEFLYTYTFLRKQNLPTREYELHIPMVVDKSEFLELLQKPEIIKFRAEHKIFMKRTIYKNYYMHEKPERQEHDVKLILQDFEGHYTEGEWLSLSDYMTDNFEKYPKLGEFFNKRFKSACKYEKDWRYW